MKTANNKKNIAVVIGSSGGVGSGIYNCLREEDEYDAVLGFHRNSKPAIDVTDEKSIKELAKFIIEKEYKISLLVNAVGYLHDIDFYPEKKVEDLNVKYIKKSFNINTFSTAFLLKYFTPIMFKNKRSLFVSISARVGSIEDNYLGGWYSYRASKSALNQLIKTASIEFKRKKSKIIFLSLHPGTVDTKLSKPFSNKKKLFTTSLAAKKILKTLNNASAEQSGSLIDYDGNIIPF